MSHLPDDPAAFLHAFEQAWADRDLDAVMSHFTEGAVYHNIPMAPCEGLDAIREFIAGFLAMGTITFETRHQVVGDDVVLNERVDTIDIDGQVTALPVCGVFEFEHGKIKAWRDYFDLGAFPS